MRKQVLIVPLLVVLTCLALLAPSASALKKRAPRLFNLYPLHTDEKTHASHADTGRSRVFGRSLHSSCPRGRRRSAARGARLAFPRAGPDRHLAFALCAPADLVRGALGAAEPPPWAPAVDPRELGCILMPGVAFSEDGLRLGRGGGYYDATLRDLPDAARVGLAFDAQIVPTLPREAHDATMDAVVTETRVLSFRRESR